MRLFFWLAAVVVSCAAIPQHGASPGELIAAVNDYRAAYGLAPYETDSGLMALAQQQSDYQASIDTRTHSRPDGSGPGDHGISSENIGGGFSVSVTALINQWSDYWHTFTLVGFSSGLAGAGVASGSDGYLYYTFVVKNTGQLTGLPAAVTESLLLQSTSGVEAPSILLTSTPKADGSVVHVVMESQTLWEIAQVYNVTVDQLAALNYLDINNPLIFPGQSILVRLPHTATTTATITETPVPPTRTLHPSRTLPPLRPTATLTLLPSETGMPLLPEETLVNDTNLSIMAFIIGLLIMGGIAALVLGLRARRRLR